MRTRATMAVGLGAIALVMLALLLARDQRRSGSDLTPNGAFVVALKGGELTCQGGELLPGDTSAVRVTLGANMPTPPVQLTVSSGGKVLTSGSLASGWRQGVVTVPVSHVSAAVGGTTVCLRNLGPGRVAVAGAVPDPGLHMQVGPASVEGRLRYDYMRPGRESWLELLPTIVHRSTLAKSGLIRGWAWAGAALLMLIAIALAARTIAREGSP